MIAKELLERARESTEGRRVFGEPYESGGVTVIPAAAVRGGGGAGGDAEEAGGGGFGVAARPVGAWIVRGDEVSWRPAVDVNRAILGGQIVAIVALLTFGRIAAARRRA
ncbi:MAG: sporulation protein [Candidatus Rokuibacteriota bacterium]|nr:MAG: sporulation protein [Candidatus Rokubacteria bacterium]